MRQTLLPSTTSTSNSTAAAAAESNSNNVVNVNKVELKASGNVISLDDLIRAKAEGASRVGTSNAKQILDEARNRGITTDEKVVQVSWSETWRFISSSPSSSSQRGEEGSLGL